MDKQSIPFLDLPGELRNKVYVFLFRSTRLKFGEKSIIDQEPIKPAANSLAILRSCRQIHAEAKSLWLKNVLFDFEDPEDLMDKLAALPQPTLSAIRHVRTRARPVKILPPYLGDANDVYYRLPFVLKLLPALCLDSLTVLDYGIQAITYQTIDMFIRHGHGWRELRVITCASYMLGFGMDDYLKMPGHYEMPPNYRREPQPYSWNEALLQRDGRDSGASVVIYRAKQPGTGSVLSPSKRDLFRQDATELLHFGRNCDQNLLADGEKLKELLIIAKRGCDADISDLGPVQSDKTDIREWTKGRADDIWNSGPVHSDNPDLLQWTDEMTWRQVRLFIGYGRKVRSDREKEELRRRARPDVYVSPEEYQFW